MEATEVGKEPFWPGWRRFGRFLRSLLWSSLWVGAVILALGPAGRAVEGWGVTHPAATFAVSFAGFGAVGLLLDFAGARLARRSRPGSSPRSAGRPEGPT